MRRRECGDGWRIVRIERNREYHPPRVKRTTIACASTQAQANNRKAALRHGQRKREKVMQEKQRHRWFVTDVEFRVLSPKQKTVALSDTPCAAEQAVVDRVLRVVGNMRPGQQKNNAYALAKDAEKYVGRGECLMAKKMTRLAARNIRR